MNNDLTTLKTETDKLFLKMNEAYEDAEYALKEANKLENEYIKTKKKWEKEAKRLVG